MAKPSDSFLPRTQQKISCMLELRRPYLRRQDLTLGLNMLGLNMLASKCRICGKREWNHVCDGGRSGVPGGVGAGASEDTGAAVPDRGGTESSVEGTGGASERVKFDRAAYQRVYMREYMRRRRKRDSP